MARGCKLVTGPDAETIHVKNCSAIFSFRGVNLALKMPNATFDGRRSFHK
jgi:hypothetical protein